MKFSRSHLDDYRYCDYYYWLRYRLGGTGVVPVAGNEDVEIGNLIHAILANCAKYIKINGDLPEGVADTFIEQEMRDPQYAWLTDAARALADGLSRAWLRIRLPLLLEEYTVVDVEQEKEVCVKGDPAVKLMVRFDLVLRRKADDALFVVDYKTTGVLNSTYLESWRYDSQTLAYAWAAEQVYGACDGILMEFLYKGYRRDGERHSPLLQGWSLTDSITGEEQLSTEYTRKTGWKKFSPWIKPGMKVWVNLLPEETLQGIVVGREVYRSQRESEIWLRQTYATVVMWQELNDQIDYPLNLSADCYSNKYGHQCPYLSVCYGEIDDPLNSSKFKRREPHHAQEFVTPLFTLEA